MKSFLGMLVAFVLLPLGVFLALRELKRQRLAAATQVQQAAAATAATQARAQGSTFAGQVQSTAAQVASTATSVAGALSAVTDVVKALIPSPAPDSGGDAAPDFSSPDLSFDLGT